MFDLHTYIQEEDDIVLDFSSGSVEKVENTATQVKVASEDEVAEETGGKYFSKFREIIKRVGITQTIEEAGNVTIFSPQNKDFDKLPNKVENVELPILRKWILKHFVKGFLFRKNMKNGPVSIVCNLCMYF